LRMNRIAALVFKTTVFMAGKILQLVLRIRGVTDQYFRQATVAAVLLMRILELR
jgi:hypothetical protein